MASVELKGGSCEFICTPTSLSLRMSDCLIRGLMVTPHVSHQPLL